MTDLGDQLDAVADRLGPLGSRSVPLAPMCTYKVGGRAALYVAASSVADLEQVTAALAGTDLPTLVVGKGSNLLVADAGFPGLVVHLDDDFSEVAVDAATGRARLGAAALLPVAARKTAAAGLTGFEWAVGVPGSVGGAVRMNAGGHGSDMAATLVRVSVFDLHLGGPVERRSADLDLAYRHSAVRVDEVVLFAELELAEGDRARSETEISEIVRWRRANQPGGQNAGSVFTNPPGDSAGRLIDEAGLKGYRIGTAEVSTKHANFIQADPDGSADDVRRVIEAVRARVRDTFGVELQCENLLIGFELPTPGAGAGPSAPAEAGAVNDGAGEQMVEPSEPPVRARRSDDQTR
ncbi:MAG: UDP-N-acetylmuramate dehydrogenase [Acidimicrobiia bacterium]|nr:UDP-N-acetylmuramate dehydrogenase [Acidimicrobiia bacterium]